MIRRFLVVVIWVTLAPVVAAQPAYRQQLLSLLPEDFAVCVAMNDLRGQSAAAERSEWFKAFRQSPLGTTLFDAPELKQLDHLQTELKKHFDLDWPGLRDDILGDSVLFAYTPGPPSKPDDERGLFLAHIAKPARLALFLDKLNDLQKKSGELKSLTPVKYKEITYQRRQQVGKTHYYLIEGSLVVLANREDLIQRVIDQHTQTPKSAVWSKRFQQAGADRAFLSLCINPRAIKPDFVEARKKDDGLPRYWDALEAIFVTLSIQDEAIVRIAVQADPDRLPLWTRAAFADGTSASELWQRFPEKSIATIASRTDIAGSVQAIKLLLPENDRKNFGADLKRGIAILGLDLFNDVLPNLGPDWGVCVVPAKDAKDFPQAIFALKVNPGTKEPAIDQTLFKSIQLFATFALLEHNKNNLDPIVIQTVMQGKVEVKYLSNKTLFAPGIQPACALKDGYLVLASSPEVIEQFRRQGTKPKTGPDAPIFRVSTRELAKLLRQRESEVVRTLTQKHGMRPQVARQNFESATTLLELLESVTLSQHSEARQSSWTLRLTPMQRPAMPK